MRTIHRDIVGGFIFSNDGKLLLGKTAPSAGGVYSGHWVVPGGGIEPGETELEALAREMLEETMIDITPYVITKTDVASGESEKLLKETGERALVQMTFHDYEIHIDKPAEQCGAQPTEELVELQWFSIDDLAKADLSSPTRAYLEKKGYIR
jgi:8-oxo-dGTP pyrophosphatase MutT (NUDIX family)